MKLKTRQEIAQAYGIHRKTLYRKLAAEGIRLNRGLLGVEDQKMIYKALGKPKSLRKSMDHDFVERDDPSDWVMIF